VSSGEEQWLPERSARNVLSTTDGAPFAVPDLLVRSPLTAIVPGRSIGDQGQVAGTGSGSVNGSLTCGISWNSGASNPELCIFWVRQHQTAVDNMNSSDAKLP
jgi:hypothetical protein